MTPSRTQAAIVALALIMGGTGAWLSLRAGSPAGTCSAGFEHMQRIELVFGLSLKGRADLGETEWNHFLDREVTPRFPDGLTVVAGNGQWRNAAGDAVKEPARLLLVWAKPSMDLDGRVDAIRKAWKVTHGQESVLRADGSGCVSF